MKLTVAESKNRILKALATFDHAAGATQIAGVLRRWGVNLGERSIRLYLTQLDAEGMTTLQSRRTGRVVTAKGRAELTSGDVIGRMAFISGQIDELNYRMGFSLRAGKGSLVVNATQLPAESLEKALEIARPVFAARLGMGTRILVQKAGESSDSAGGPILPRGKAAIVTVCSVTLNGILLKEGIPVTSRYGGLMEYRNREPVRFVELLEYGGTTQDPLELFIRSKMTSVLKCARTGNGLVGASFREFPSVALAEVIHIRDRLKQAGLDGIVAVGAPDQPLFGIPVGEGRTGMVVHAGLNPVAALEESGIENLSRSLAGLIEYGQFQEYQETGVPLPG